MGGWGCGGGEQLAGFLSPLKEKNLATDSHFTFMIKYTLIIPSVCQQAKHLVSFFLKNLDAENENQQYISK